MRPWKVTVRSASTAAPAVSPVEASTPEGRSTATTGAPHALIRSITAAASGRGAPWKPGSEERVDDEVGVRRVVRLDDVPARLAQDPSCDPPVAAVRAAAAHGGDASRLGVRASTSSATAAPARSISSLAEPG